MKVLLVNPPAANLDDKYYPLGLGYLCSSLIDGGFEVDVRDLNANPKDSTDFTKYDAVAITATTPQILCAYEVLNEARKAKPNIHTILGGVHASSLPNECLSKCDCVVVGEGEFMLPKVIHEKRTGIANSELIKDLDRLSMPNRTLFPLSKYTIPRTQVYTKSRRFTSVITSRGCPFDCYYCWNSKFRNPWRGRSPENVNVELEEIKSLGIEEVMIEDDQFTLNKVRCIEICKHLAKHEFCWSLPNGVHINTIDEELLRTMKDSGLHHISYGVESGNSDVLRNINGKDNLERVRAVVDITKRLGIRMTLLFMIGLKGDNENTMQQTIDLAKTLNPDNATFSVCVPYPSSIMYDWVKQSLDGDWNAFAHSHPVKLEWSCADFPSRELCRKYSRKAYREFYLRPSYVLTHPQNVLSLSPQRLKALFREIK